MQGRVGIYKLPGGKIIYKVNVASAPDNLKTADNEEKIIYRIIEEAGNKGIWIRDIRSRSNLLPKQLDKVLRSLENSKTIKSVKTVNVSNTLILYRKYKIANLYLQLISIVGLEKEGLYALQLGARLFVDWWCLV